MSDDQVFLKQILADLNDDTARFIYADWLEERGDDLSVKKAQFLRLECEWAKLPKRKRAYSLALQQLQELASQLESDWLAVVSKLAIENCLRAFRFKCPQKWEKLQATENPNVRHCDSCQQGVHYCSTIAEARAEVARGTCVAIELSVLRRQNDLAPLRIARGLMISDGRDRDQWRRR